MALTFHYYRSKEEIEVLGFVEIQTSADLLMFINRHGGRLEIPGTVTKACVYGVDGTYTYLLVTMDGGEKVFYNFEIGQRVKKRFKLGELWRQLSTDA